MPKSLRKADCWRARATISFTHIWLEINDGPGAGAYPTDYRIADPTGHKPCL
ncbi:hypothetical protein [Parachitinimonas caeni]|uniref:Uncharacterized protein n=1 Tax=Parachitinimonas caeni TaxID=3031301 RepID=A0ABT7DVP0_9NEIS|nr:hypothetical protein [Parachitinimonas caeni]MDK2124126.1 hypothetical protein [Parachitinimonas caeni]